MKAVIMNPFSFSPTAGISLFCGLGLDKNFNNRVRLVHFFNRDTFQVLDGKPGNGNGNNKDNTGSGNKGNGNGNKKGAVAAIADFFTGEEPEAGKLGAGVSQALVEHLFSEEILGGLAEGLGIQEETVTAQEETGTDSSDTANADYGQTMTATPGNAAPGAVSPGNAAASYAGKNDNGNNGNGGNGNHYGWGNGNNGNGNNGNGNGNSGNGNGNSSTGGTNDNNGNASGNTNNTGGSQNQSGILFPVAGEVSELEQELIDMIKTTGKQKNYELVEYVNDVNRDHVEVLMELNINGIMDTAYSYGNERLTNERFTGWTGYYTYDPRGSVTGVTGSDGYIWQSYRYNAFGDITFGKPQYNNVYSYNAENFNPNMDAQYLRVRYYSVKTAGFISEDSYLGDITDPLTLNRYNYVKGSPLNYMDPSGHVGLDIFAPPSKYVHTGDIPVANDSNATRPNDNGNVQGPPPSPVPNSFGEHAKTLLSKLFEIAIKRKTKDECQREWEEITGGDPMYGFDSPTDDFIDIIIGANYALMNKGIETVGLLNNLIYNYRYRYENEAMVKNAEQWVVDNLIYDPANFYLGKLFGDIILASYSVKEIELLLSKLGAIAGGGSIGAAGALGATAQAEIDELLVVAGLEDSAAAGAFLSVVYASLPEDWEKFRKAFKEVNGNTSSSSGSRIIKETDNYIDYVNESGTKVRIPKQTEGSISKSIQSNLTSTNTGTAIEAKVAN